MRICLVTAGHVSFQPRTLREADALSAAGHDVRVVCRQTDAELIEHDRSLMHGRNWRLQAVELNRNGKSQRSWLINATKAKLFEQAFVLGLRHERVASRAYVRGLRAAITLASAQKADWFIAHTQAALPIAASAAKRWNARLGFDCEDLLAEMGADPSEIVRAIERAYLPQCDYISVPSSSIAERLAAQYELKPPVVLYNVFPLKLAAGLIRPEGRPRPGVLRLHWFSQTIGQGRGLEEAIEAARLLGPTVEIHLRGRVNEEYRRRLQSLASGVELRFHPIVPYDELIGTLDQFDVGLAVESPDNNNVARTVSNKLFSYLLAGLAIAATDTPGQREVIEQTPAAGFLYPAGQPHVLAEKLRRWVDDRAALRAAQKASWDAARARFCWDVEREKLFQLIASPRSAALAQTA